MVFMGCLLISMNVRWPMVRKTLKTLYKSELFQWSVKVWKEIIAWSHAMEGATHILFILCYCKSKRPHKIMPTFFYHTISLVRKRHWINWVLVLNKIYSWVKLAVSSHSVLTYNGCLTLVGQHPMKPLSLVCPSFCLSFRPSVHPSVCQ